LHKSGLNAIFDCQSRKTIMTCELIGDFGSDDAKIYWGEALNVLECRVPDRSVDLVFVDPPYNIGKQFGDFYDRWPTDEAYAGWCYKWVDLCIRKLKRTGSMYVMTSTQAMPHLDLYLRKKMVILSRIIWHYDSSGVQAKSYFGSMYEPILFCVKDAKKYTFNADSIKVEARTGAQRKLIDYRKAVPTQYNSDKVPGNVWYYPRVRYRMDEYEEHPSQKPEALMERIIKASSNPGDMVLDPFAGTFTTSAVAKRLGRKSISIEREEKYIPIGLRRLSIADAFQGIPLAPPAKTFTRRASPQDTGLFEIA
jgi:adenine-specific DNA-methyltransferase